VGVDGLAAIAVPIWCICSADAVRRHCAFRHCGFSTRHACAATSPERHPLLLVRIAIIAAAVRRSRSRS
jgi:hypothetical protein